MIYYFISQGGNLRDGIREKASIAKDFVRRKIKEYEKLLEE